MKLGFAVLEKTDAIIKRESLEELIILDAFMVVEQTKQYQKRMKYCPETNQFAETEWDSLSFVRSVPYPYGWLKGFGTPPERHLDILLISEKEYELGEIVPVKIIGVFIRNDGDSKLIAILPERLETDYSQLPEKEKRLLLKLYPDKYEGEGWFGTEIAEEVIRKYSDNSCNHKTESVTRILNETNRASSPANNSK